MMELQSGFATSLWKSQQYTRLAFKRKWRTKIPSVRKNITLSTYPQVFNYLLRTYTTDGNITDREDEINMFSQPPRMTLSQYAEKLVVKVLRCRDVYEEHYLNEIFVMRLGKLIRQGMRDYWDSCKISWSSRRGVSCNIAIQATRRLKRTISQPGPREKPESTTRFQKPSSPGKLDRIIWSGINIDRKEARSQLKTDGYMV